MLAYRSNTLKSSTALEKEVKVFAFSSISSRFFHLTNSFNKFIEANYHMQNVLSLIGYSPSEYGSVYLVTEKGNEQELYALKVINIPFALHCKTTDVLKNERQVIYIIKQAKRQ